MLASLSSNMNVIRFSGYRWIEWYIGGTGLQDREEPDHEILDRSR